MNYQHAYHAGCIADVFKHVVLLQLLKTLHHKSSPYCYIETHAGKAFYDLQAAQPQKTLEYKTGIEMLYDSRNSAHPAITEYLNVVRSLNAVDVLKIYPSSHLIAHHYLREGDEAILCELHPEIAQILAHYYQTDKRVHVHFRNGYEALAALIPPKLKRGVVFIDPPYERPDEYAQIIQVLEKSQKRWPTGIYGIWFPIKQYEVILNFYHQLQSLPFPKILTAEFWSAGSRLETDNRIRGSGLVIINPPWKFDTLLTELLPHLAMSLNLTESPKIAYLREE